MKHAFFEKGWYRFRHDPAIAAWVERTLPAAREAVVAPENRQWLRCGGTWFAGVHALPNDTFGAVSGGPPLAGEVIGFIGSELGHTTVAWDRGQVSVCYPGYPRPMEGETEAAYRFRLRRDAAHVDGLVPEGPERRRHLREHHGFLLGLPMIRASADASPFVIWEGSHEIMRSAFRDAFAGVAPEDRGALDVTAAYQAARRLAFERCPRREIAAGPGEAYLVHRLALHGVAPWGEQARAGPDGRMVVYFRPEMFGPGEWLAVP